MCKISRSLNLKLKQYVTSFWWVSEERHNSIADALELRLSCTNPSISDSDLAKTELYSCQLYMHTCWQLDHDCDFRSLATGRCQAISNHSIENKVTQTANALGLTSIRYWAEVEVSDRYLINITPRVLAIWEAMHPLHIWGLLTPYGDRDLGQHWLR